MSTSVSSVTNHFPSAENGFTTTLASTISSGATTVPLNSVAGYANGEIVAFIVDPSDAAKKQTFTGTIDTAGVQVTGVIWTAGTNQTHNSGATVVDYASATHISMMTKGILVEHGQTGAHSTVLITGRTEDTTPASADSILTYDTSATALKKATIANILANNATSVGGAWTSWTPTITYNGGGSTGNATITAKYIQIGKNVFFRFRYVVGSTTSFSGLTSLDISMPVTANSELSSGALPMATVRFLDSGVNNYGGIAIFNGTVITPYAIATTGSYGSWAGMSATVPFSWGVSDEIGIVGNYEAA